MPLIVNSFRKSKCNINFQGVNGWTITFKHFDVCYSISKTHFGNELWKINFDPPLEIIPNQEIKIGLEGQALNIMEDKDAIT